MKNIVFDLGGVLLEWKPKEIVKNFSNDENVQNILLDYIHSEEKWAKWDSGELSDQEFAVRTAEVTGLPVKETERFLELIRESLLIIPGTHDLVKFAIDKGKNVYCISNMPEETYDYLKMKFNFFELFNGIIISGIEKTIKPDPKIFKLFLDKYSLIPEETLFLDDNQKNIDSAGLLGINGIKFSAEPDCYNAVKNIILNGMNK